MLFRVLGTIIGLIIFAYLVKKFTEGFASREVPLIDIWSFYGKIGKSIISFIAIIIIVTMLFPHNKEISKPINNHDVGISKKNNDIKITKQDLINSFDNDYKEASKKYLNKQIQFTSEIDDTSGDTDNLSDFNSNENNFSSYLIGKTIAGKQVDIVMTTESHQDLEFNKEYTWTGKLSKVSQYEGRPSVFDFIDVKVK
ncbi:OB-fold protein [Weissella koreensis]|uniref:Uncharacterized protein n=2 Tax=Weissella koreensis TaxID=165096 RepID=A0A7H1MKG2_9LACO|nr:hypothetical protein [Weissella koreensis]AVH74691.1 hypothetical protein C4597_01055 [Weissella koreensis]EJF34046.1 hypothetical protein JC2156_03540 [Weissella koreensis KCTC 3621]QGN19914.1 hypothetical protein GKC51_01025 [Weissella koreensis]QNT63948.1 hypothetical protein FY536_01060 [Weissella koreensis]